MRYTTLAGILFLVLQAGLVLWFSHPGSHIQAQYIIEPTQPAPTPTIDPLALPVLSEHPTQVELGKSLYYYHCMPCHGDKGQGLTDEWREVWEEDHQDCWASGCHSSKDQDKAFTIPTLVPPVSGNADFKQHFAKPDILFEYLRITHPPQKPGILKDDEYWALTAYLLANNGLISPHDQVGPQAGMQQRKWIIVAASIIAGCVLTVLLIIMKRKAIYRLASLTDRKR